MKTRLVIAPKDASDLKSQVLQAEQYKPNGYEIRIDHTKDVFYTHQELLEKISALKVAKRSIITLRSKGQGGKFSGSDADKMIILRNVLKTKPELIDIELDFAIRNQSFVQEVKKSRVKTLVSCHDFEGTKDIAELAAMMVEMSLVGDKGKVITTANSVQDLLTLLKLKEFADKMGFDLTTFAMGELGAVSRAISAQNGGIAYTSFPGGQNAPGQLDIEKLNELKRIRKNRSLLPS